MKFGLALPHYDYSFPDGGPVTFERVADAAARAESLGFDSVWISDHFFLSLAKYGGGDALHGTPEAMTALAGLAARTERVRLGTMVLGAAFRHPGLLAKAATAVELYSHGRFELGIGAGWYGPEFEAFGYPMETDGERFAQLEEAVQVLQALFHPGPSTFAGERHELREAHNNPQPSAPVPVWIGAKGGPRALRLAARHADGWNTAWRWTPEAYAERARGADAACEAEGRDPATLRRSVGLYLLIGEDAHDLEARWRDLRRWTPGGALDGDSLEDYARDTLAGTPERVRETVGAYAALGVEEIIVNAASMPFAVADWSLAELFAESVGSAG